jgi:hypothetical protein
MNRIEKLEKKLERLREKGEQFEDEKTKNFKFKNKKFLTLSKKGADQQLINSAYRAMHDRHR